jgi:hypothetical protein
MATEQINKQQFQAQLPQLEGKPKPPTEGIQETSMTDWQT